MAMSFVGGGNRSTGSKPRPVAGTLISLKW